MKNSILSGTVMLVCAAATLTATPTIAKETPLRERIPFDTGWRFIKGDPTNEVGVLDYSRIKAWVLPTGNEFTTNAALSALVRPKGNPGDLNPAYAQSDFNDSRWRLLNLPHDWGIEGPFKQEYPGETGKLPWWGVAWYRKTFPVTASDLTRRVYLQVDGAMAYATVWVNGWFVGGWPYGYASWELDLTPYLKLGSANVVAIRLDNPPNSSRWYPGGGIYRNVWLVKTAPVHVDHWGTYITTPEVSKTSAKVNMQVQVRNDSTRPQGIEVHTRIYELTKEGEKGRSVEVDVPSVQIASVATGKVNSAEISFNLSSPRLWSTKDPQLYVAETTLSSPNPSNSEAALAMDQYDTIFGVRSAKFDPDRGFFLNGEHVPLQGVCDHHDLGALGSALNTRALERQIQLLQDMGCNAIRTSHNPPAPELLDLCDRMGMLVMDESFDCWQRGKTRNDYHLLFNDWHEKDWRAELRRDRNHPSVILWSIGNEVGEQGTPASFPIAGELTRIAHEEDPTRPTTAACNDLRSAFSGFSTNLDVFGYNYKPNGYPRAHETNSAQPIFGSETASCVSSRGEYFFPVSTNKLEGRADFQVSSYDLYAPRWAWPPDVEFRGLDAAPFAAGEFVWTGFDYLGEPTPYGSDSTTPLNFTDPTEQARMDKELKELGKIRVPSRSSYFGIIDLAGFKKDRFFIYQARWRPDFPMAHILPHWTWPERVGQVTPVHVYTSGDSAELFLNDKSLGRKTKGPLEYRLVWDDVIYRPGELKVVAYKHGHKWATDTVKTAGPATRLELSADRDKISADGKDLSYVTVTITDKKGVTVPRASDRVQFKLEGPGELVATDNGDPTDLDVFSSMNRKAFNGRCLAIVRSKAGETGSIRITAEAEGLKSDDVTIKTRD